MPRRIPAWRPAIDAIGGSVRIAIAAIAAGFLTGCAASSNSPMASMLGSVGQPGISLANTAGTQASFAATAETEAAFSSVRASGGAACRIGAQDVLDVSVFKVAELSKSVDVADTGTVNLPLVGEVRAAGKTLQQRAEDFAGCRCVHTVTATSTPVQRKFG